MAGFSQGMALGGLVQGIDVVDRGYAGGWWDWLSPFSLLTGLAVATGYALLGATWLVMKLEGGVHDRMRRVAQPLGLATLVFLGLVSLFTPLQDEVYFQRWFSGGSLVFSVAVPVLVLLCAAGLWKGLRGGGDRLPFFSALGFFVLGFIGIGISFYPMIVPPSLTIVEAAAPDSSLAFALVGTVILIPIILAYTAYAYWVFRGKIDPSEGYH